MAAPGGNIGVDINGDSFADGILSTLVDDSQPVQSDIYVFYQGTSMASPHVAGVAALMKAVYPNLSATQFETSLQSGLLSDDIGLPGRDDLFGFGLINAVKSLQQAQLLAGGTAYGSIIARPTRLHFDSSNLSQSISLIQVGDTPPSVTVLIRHQTGSLLIAAPLTLTVPATIP